MLFCEVWQVGHKNLRWKVFAEHWFGLLTVGEHPKDCFSQNLQTIVQSLGSCWSCKANDITSLFFQFPTLADGKCFFFVTVLIIPLVEKGPFSHDFCSNIPQMHQVPPQRLKKVHVTRKHNILAENKIKCVSKDSFLHDRCVHCFSTGQVDAQVSSYKRTIVVVVLCF